MTTTNNITIRIYLTNLGMYNEGILCGEWVDLPCDDFAPIFDRLHICHDDVFYGDAFGNPYEEWFITDYETNIGLSINEYENIDELNDFAESIQALDENVVAALLYFGVDYENLVDESDNIITWCDCEDMTDVAMQYIDECGLLNNNDILSRYFDYESYGRDMDIEGQFYFADDGNCYEYVG